jgi:hypothetical protein
MTLNRLVSRVAFAATALALLAQAGCKKAVVAPVTIAGVTIVQGNLQIAQAGSLLPTPVVLRVVDANGDGVPAVTVVFAVAAGGGTVTPASILTDAHGEVTVKWTLGQSAPLQTLTAAVGDGTPVMLVATALFPATVAAAQGNSQTGKPGQALANNVVIRVTGDLNTPLSGIPVQFQVTAGGGAISPQTALTNAFGEVTVKWTLGTAVGTQSATAAASTLSPVQLTATAAP